MAVVGPPDAHFLLGDAGDRAQARRAVPAVLEQRLPVASARIEELFEAVALQLLEPIARELRSRLVGIDDPTLGVDAQYRVRQLVDVDHLSWWARHCLARSKQSTAAAMPTLSDSVRPAIGMVTVPSSSAARSSGRPWASLPSTSAVGAVRSTLSYAAPRWAAVRKRRIPQ